MNIFIKKKRHETFKDKDEYGDSRTTITIEKTKFMISADDKSIIDIRFKQE